MRLFLIMLIIALQAQIGPRIYAEQNDIDLAVGYVDPTIPHGHNPKSPILIPHVAIDGHTLYFFTPCDGCELQLLDEEGNVVYNVIIPGGSATLALPSYLSGNYEIQIIRGNYLFWGYINII